MFDQNLFVCCAFFLPEVALLATEPTVTVSLSHLQSQLGQIY